MQANLITLIRVLLVFVVVALFQVNVYLSAAMLVLSVIVIWMDALDGYVARKLKLSSDFGALFDIVGDRIVEQVFWIYFATVGLVPMWVPLIVITRTILTDMVRSVAFKDGKTPFGQKTMMQSWWARALVSSRVSRAGYGILKAVGFCYLGAIITLGLAEAEWSLHISDNAWQMIVLAGQGLVYFVVAFCIVRGLPVLWDGRRYLMEDAHA